MRKNKDKNKRPDDVPNHGRAFQVPIGKFATVEEFAAYIEIVNRPGTLPNTITVDQLVAAMVDGTWFRTTRSEADGCGDSDHRDALLVGLFRPQVEHVIPEAVDWITLTAVDACEGRLVTCIFDRESMRAHVNACVEAIAASEHRSYERAATTKASS